MVVRFIVFLTSTTLICWGTDISKCSESPLEFEITRVDCIFLMFAKVSCIFHHWDVQLILAYSWARPAILVAGKGRGEWFVSSLSFLFLFLPCPSLSSPLVSLLSLSSLSLGDDTKWPTRVDVSLNPQHNQSISDILQKIGFDIRLETICMECQFLFSVKNKTDFQNVICWKFYLEC